MSSRPVPNIVDAATLADDLVRFRVVESEQLTELLAEFAGTNPAALAEFLVHRRFLTPFQANQALAGETRLLSLGPYRILTSAGIGPFGTIYAATHKDHPGAAYRIRVFPLRSLWRARQAKQLIRSLAHPPHRLIVPPIDADSAHGLHYLVWSHVEGESLADRVARAGPLAHLAEALHACHARGIVHGAITPSSVLLGPDSLPRLLELGAGAVLATNLVDEESLLDTLSCAIAARGVLEYASPEFAANPISSPAADQYALGAVGYFALSGHAPFPAPRLSDQFAAKQAGSPQSLEFVNPDVLSELAAIIDQMLRPDPGDRFPNLDAVQSRLASLTGSLHDDHPMNWPGELPEPDSSPPAPVEIPVSGNALWPRSESRTVRFSSRDGSDASIDFEVPAKKPEVVVQPAPPRHPMPLEEIETPNRRMLETQMGVVPTVESPEFPQSPSQPSPPSPEPCISPGLEPKMAKPRSSSPTPPDPRKGVGSPVHYHTETPPNPNSLSGLGPVTPAPMSTSLSDSDERPPPASPLWKTLKRNLLFWQAATDVVQVSVFGPLAVLPGQQTRVTVYLHGPDAADSVRTLSRAFHHDSELIGSGFVAREVARDSQLAIHLSVMNAGVSKSLMNFIWRGQPQRLVFDLHVPWEAPSGPAPGLVSVGRNEVRIGKIEFRLNLLPRKV
jgi:serine/threonine kinase PknH